MMSNGSGSATCAKAGPGRQEAGECIHLSAESSVRKPTAKFLFLFLYTTSWACSQDGETERAEGSPWSGT